MELIEAIYLSVGLFAVAIIVVLVISFTSYKLKKKLGLGEDTAQVNHELKPKLESKNGKPIVKRASQSKHVKSKTVKQKSEHKDRRKVEKIRTEKKIERITQPRKNIITKTEQPRIEVLNKKEPIKTKPVKEEPKKSVTSNQTTKDINFDHYSDYDDQDDFKSMTDEN